jgi:hypothetical protein
MIIEDLKQIDRRYRQENPELFEVTTPDEQELEGVEHSIGGAPPSKLSRLSARIRRR